MNTTAPHIVSSSAYRRSAGTTAATKAAHSAPSIAFGLSLTICDTAAAARTASDCDDTWSRSTAVRTGSAPAFSAELYVNGLCVNTEVHEVFSRHTGFSLIRVHRRQRFAAQASGAELLDQLKFPAEFLLVTARSRALAGSFGQWWLSGAPEPRPPATALLFPYAVWNPDPQVSRAELAIATAEDASVLAPLVRALGVTAHGIDLYALTPAAFYSSYLPIRYPSAANTVPPIDSSVFLIPFCLRPGAAQPSGYYNLSSGRELYLRYEMNENVAHDSELLVTMSALNFLVRSGDTIKLRFMI